MSPEQKLLKSLMKEFAINELVTAVEKQATDSAGRRLQFKALFASYLDAYWDKEMVPVAGFIKHYYDSSSDAKLLKTEEAADLVGAVCDVLRGQSMAKGALAASEWVDALKLVAARDAVDTLKTLDEAGLIDWSDLQSDGPVRELWASAVLNTAERCGRYLMGKASIADLGGFPIPGRDIWPESLQMARDIVANIPEADLEKYLVELYDVGSWSSKDQLWNKSVGPLCAALERCDAIAEKRALPIFKEVLDAVVHHTALKPHPELRGFDVADILLRLMESNGRLSGNEALVFAEHIVTYGGDDGALSPSRLAKLLERGLPVQGVIERRRGEIDALHLMTHARERHIDVISPHVRDKEQFMREFGSEFMSAHSLSSPNRNTTDIEKAVQGSDNAALQKMVSLGYPIGPIELNQGYLKEPYPLYKRAHYGAAVDAFIVGHLMGQLGAEHAYHGVGPLHLAVAMGHVPSARALVSAGFSLEEPCGRSSDGSETRCYNTAGMTPLLMAIKSAVGAWGGAVMFWGGVGRVPPPPGAWPWPVPTRDAVKQLIRAARTSSTLGKAVDNGPSAAEPGSTKSRQLSAL
jgi:hypothetical protein